MKNIKFSRLFAAMMFVAVLALTGCKQNADPSPKKIEGTWVSTYGEKYVISGSEVKNYYTDSATKEFKLTYTGNSVEIKELTDTTGYIYMKYTRSANADWTYSETAPDVGKWYALYYFELADKSVKISGAAKTGGKTSCATLDEAKTEFTVANGYFTGSSPCAKQ